MIFLSLLAKTFALALFYLHPWLAAALWLVGAAADVQIGRKSSTPWKNVVCLQVAALVLGWVAVGTCDYAAMRWKDGIPVFATMLDWLLSLCGQSVGSQNGHIYISTMAGPLDFAATLDGLALKVPAVFFAMAAVWLLWAESSLAEVARKLGILAAVLIVVALARMACIVLLANGLFDFVGYESEELPWRPFMDEAANVWAYLPFFLAVGALVGRQFSPPVLEREMRPALRPVMVWGGLAVLFLLGLATYWQPAGTMKSGRLVIAGYHSQWSRSDRPYDREWYGADSGYNYAVMKRLFEKFYQVSDATGPITAADLDGASILVVYDPDRRFSQEEIGRIREFVRSGGGLLVIGDHTNVFGSTSHINELCGPFGFQYRDDVLFDLDADFHQVMDAPSAPNGFWHGTSFFKLRGPTSIRPTSLWTRCIYDVGHSKSVRAIYSVNNFYPPPHDDPKMRFGDYAVATASHYGSGRIVAWADSTVFSNFEIFYPGKYEFLLNTSQWLNHKDGIFAEIGRRLVPLTLVLVLGAFLLLRREPRIWLATLLAAAVVLGATRSASGWFERRRAEFPKPIQPSEWVIFAADAKDKGHHLRDFMGEGPYDQRYEVLNQWVLRTGAFSGFHILGDSKANGLYREIASSNTATTALALIVRKPEDLPQLRDLAEIPARANDPLLLMFSATIPPETAVEEIRKAGLIRNAETLAKVAQAWPAGEVILDDNGRRVVIVANAERFSDQAMGISEKVTPDAAQKVLFGQSFAIIDQLLGHPPAAN